MFNDFKYAFQSFKKNIADYLAISFVFSVLMLICFLVGKFILGAILAIIIVAVPAIISLKFCAYHSCNKEEVEFGANNASSVK